MFSSFNQRYDRIIHVCVYWFEMRCGPWAPRFFFFFVMHDPKQTPKQACCTGNWRYDCFLFEIISTCLFFFRLKLGNKILLWPPSFSSRSFNILANKKFNRNSILRFQLIEISPHFLFTASHMQNVEIKIFHYIFPENNPWKLSKQNKLI